MRSEVEAAADAVVDVEGPACEADAGEDGEAREGAEEPAAVDVHDLQQEGGAAEERGPAGPADPIGQLGCDLPIVGVDRLAAAHRPQQLPAAGTVQSGEG